MAGKNQALHVQEGAPGISGKPSGLVPAEGGLVVFRWFGANAPRTLGLPEQIAATIGDRIATGIIAPGARIIEQEIADEFETSRGPVREALRILEREKLARIHPRRGARATQLSEQDVFDLFEIRALLYQAVGRALAEKRPPEAIRMMEAEVGNLRHLAEQRDAGEGYASLVFRLSLGSARASGNRLLAELLTSLALQTHRYTRLGLRSRARRRVSAATWQDYLAAIRRGDAGTAADLASRLVLAARAEVLRLLAADPALANWGAAPPHPGGRSAVAELEQQG